MSQRNNREKLYVLVRVPDKGGRTRLLAYTKRGEMSTVATRPLVTVAGTKHALGNAGSKADIKGNEREHEINKEKKGTKKN